MSVSVTLKSIIQESKDGEWGKEQFFDDSVKMGVIRGTDFDDVRVGSIKDIPIRYIPKHIAARKTLQPDDIVIETAGGSKDRPTGRTLFIKQPLLHTSELPLTCASFSRFIRLDSSKVIPKYVFWHLQHLYMTGYLTKYHTQHTGVSRFQFTTFSEQEKLIFPPLPIQLNIASILSAYDDLIENNSRKIKILEEMAQTIYDEWFIKYRFPGHNSVKMVKSELGEIPEGWIIKQLDDTIGILSGFAFKSGTFTNNGKYGLVTIKNVQDGKFISECDSRLQDIPEKMPEYCLLKDGDILLSLTGNVGRVCLCYGKDYLLNQRVAKLAPKDETDWAYVYFMYFQPQFRTKLEMFSTGVAQQNLSPIEMGKMKIIYPTETIRKKYADLCNPILDEMLILFQKNKVLQETRDLLLPRLISSELDVENIDIKVGN